MNKKIFYLLGIFLISIIISWNLFQPGYFSMHDDLHVMRLYEMKRCLLDGQIPCRWAPDMGAGYGQPVFSYYSATPYYAGAFFDSLGFSLIDSVKLIMFISISLGGIAMFLFLCEFLSLLPAFIGGVAYMLVPFRASEIFVRGALSENFALALLPLVLYGIIRLIKRQDKISFALSSVFIGLFLASHNITTMVSFPLISILTFAVLMLNKNKSKNIFLLSFSALLGLGLAAFFLFPVIFEKKLINTSVLTTDYFDFRAHFVTLKQLFIDQRWEYGGSRFGPDDSMSFAVGIIQTIALFVAPIVLFFKRKIFKKENLIILTLFWILGIFYLFLTHAKSFYLWEMIKTMSFIQFPWRLLGIVAICSSAVIAFLLSVFDQKIQKILTLSIIVILFVFNFRFFKFNENNITATDLTYLTGENFYNLQKSAMLDYRVLSLNKVPTNIAPANPTILSGEGSVNNFTKRSNYFFADVEVNSDTVVVSFPISSFPNWTVYLNNNISSTPYISGEDYGELTITFNKGHNIIQGYFENTLLRSIANTITLISFIILLVVVSTKDVKKNN